MLSEVSRARALAGFSPTETAPWFEVYARRLEIIRPTQAALDSSQLQAEYFQCWQGLKKHFDPNRRGPG